MEMKEIVNGARTAASDVARNAIGSVGSPNSGDRKGSKKKLYVAVAVGIVLIVIIALITGGRKKVNMEDYVQVLFSGLDEKGRAELIVDYRGILQELPDRKSKEKNKDTLGAVADGLAGNNYEYAVLENAVHFELDKADGLRNGDKVNVSVSVNDDQCKHLGIKVKETTLAFKVQGLIEVEPFDAFADISVEFSGTSPLARAEIIKLSDKENAYSYSLDKSSELALGDTVTVSISEDNIDEIAEQTGKVPAELTKQYVVENVQYFITELSQLPEEALADMQQESVDRIKSSTTYSGKYLDWSFVEAEYLGSYFFALKPERSDYAKNTAAINDLSLFYKVTSIRTDNKGNQIKRVEYHYTVFANISNGPDGVSRRDMFFGYKGCDTLEESRNYCSSRRNMEVLNFESTLESTNQ